MRAPQEGRGARRARGHGLFACAVFVAMTVPRPASADDGGGGRPDSAVPRQWNPLSAGPQLLSSPGVQAAGQMFVRLYGFSELGYAQYGGGWSFTPTRSLARRLIAVSPQIELDYGLLPWMELGLYASEASWWQSSGHGLPAASGNGLADTTPYVKFRLHVQRLDDPFPWIASMFLVALPTSDWAGPLGTPPIPGGFAPLGRLPATHFGAPELTEALLFRENVRPFRFAAGLYYSYALPGDGHAYGDIFQYRMTFEHFLNDERGLAYAVEVIGLHGLPFRLDGQAVNSGTQGFGVLGIQPTIEYNLTDHVIGALGVLFNVLGKSDIAALYPNLSIYYYWSPSGRVEAR